jgi:hypothetical protein
MAFVGSGHEVVKEKIESKIFVWKSVGKEHVCILYMYNTTTNTFQD